MPTWPSPIPHDLFGFSKGREEFFEGDGLPILYRPARVTRDRRCERDSDTLAETLPAILSRLFCILQV